jgi:hypothetical protein
VSLNKAYINKLAKLSGVSPDKIDYCYRKAFLRLNCDPVKDIALIAKVIKNLAKEEKSV